MIAVSSTCHGTSCLLLTALVSQPKQVCVFHQRQIRGKPVLLHRRGNTVVQELEVDSVSFISHNCCQLKGLVNVAAEVVISLATLKKQKAT